RGRAARPSPRRESGSSLAGNPRRPRPVEGRQAPRYRRARARLATSKAVGLMVASSGEQAVANARQVDTYPVGMCLKFVREQWRIGSLYGSAIDAWYGAVDRHPGDRTPPL